ncbi:hypothetical protein F5876DRAFT_66585 [Lentinula aff. lateritia]|uniref:Uncharacterized protein n=1 Tax=Lentinula aff. lateritia TaxID=2804960 RepID=A0ACC1TXS8_9AGAR|nr:hypothetical protein F5876DRAFT_66585 [Lentinula aff. lateritia]
MVRLTPLLTFALSVLLVSASPVRRTLAKIQSDITKADALISTWDNSVDAFEGSPNQANAIHSAAVQLVSALNQAATDTKSNSKKSTSFAGIRGATAIAEQDIGDLQSSTAALLNAISSITPAEVVSQATQFAVTLNDAYEDALTTLAKQICVMGNSSIHEDFNDYNPDPGSLNSTSAFAAARHRL